MSHEEDELLNQLKVLDSDHKYLLGMGLVFENYYFENYYLIFETYYFENYYLIFLISLILTELTEPS